MGIKTDDRLTPSAMPRMGLMNDLARFGVKFDKPDDGGAGDPDPAPADDPAPKDEPKGDDPEPKGKPDDNGGNGGKGDDPANKKVDDEKAELLKDLMKKKERAQKAESEAKEASKAKEQAEKRIEEINQRIARALGVEDVDKLEEAIGKLEKDEESRLAAAGEWEKLKERLVGEHRKELERVQGTKDQEIGELKKKYESAESEIRRLLVSNTFAASGFINDELTLSPTHAERLFGDHFKVEVGENGQRTVKAVNAKGEPLVDKDGNALPFDEALKEIVNADPDKDRLFKPKAKPGAGSGAKGTGAEPPVPDNVRGSSRIARALSAKK